MSWLSCVSHVEGTQNRGGFGEKSHLPWSEDPLGLVIKVCHGPFHRYLEKDSGLCQNGDLPPTLIFPQVSLPDEKGYGQENLSSAAGPARPPARHRAQPRQFPVAEWASTPKPPEVFDAN